MYGTTAADPMVAIPPFRSETKTVAFHMKTRWATVAQYLLPIWSFGGQKNLALFLCIHDFRISRSLMSVAILR